MKQFLDKDFLLSTEMAKTIYHDYAENMPVSYTHLLCSSCIRFVKRFV